MRKYVPLMVNYLNKVDDWEVQYCCLSALSFICIKMLQMDSEMLLLFINDIKQCKGYPSHLLITLNKNFHL